MLAMLLRAQTWAILHLRFCHWLQHWQETNLDLASTSTLISMTLPLHCWCLFALTRASFNLVPSTRLSNFAYILLVCFANHQFDSIHSMVLLLGIKQCMYAIVGLPIMSHASGCNHWWLLEIIRYYGCIWLWNLWCIWDSCIDICWGPRVRFFEAGLFWSWHRKY